MKNEEIKVAITLGDYNGVGPEVMLKALAHPKMVERCTPILYASPKVLGYFKKAFNLQDLNFQYIKDAEQAHAKKLNLLITWEEETVITPGVPSAEAGAYALKSLARATEDAIAGKVQALVTTPLDKSTVHTPALPFSGHTEYLAAADQNKALMLLICEDLKVALTTGHIPLAKVSSVLTTEKVEGAINQLKNSLIHDFGINKPRIAVLALNPHAGDNGLMGEEEEKIIRPVIEKYKNDMAVVGPYPADGFFGARLFQKFDAVLAMYHDQGLIPFKYLGFEDGVNYTAGLSFVRTSPDHGTAYDIASKNIASELSMRNAIYAAIDIYKKRKNLMEIGENPLAFSAMRRERFRMDF